VSLGSFRILLPFFLTSWGVGVLNSAIFKLIRMLEWNTKHFPLNLQSGLTLLNFRDVGGGFEIRNQIRHCKTFCIKRNLYLINYNPMRTHCTTKGNRDAVLLACAIEDSTDIFGISGGGGFERPKPPLGTPLILPVTLCLNILVVFQKYLYFYVRNGIRFRTLKFESTKYVAFSFVNYS